MRGNLVWTVKLLYVSNENYIHSQANNGDISLTQAMILRLLYSLDGSEVYAVDLHNALRISKASVSSAIKMLKKNGYLKITVDSSDDRKKKLVLTEKAYSVQDTIAYSLQKQQELLCQNIPADHLPWLEEDLNIMISNLKNKKIAGQEEQFYA